MFYKKLILIFLGLFSFILTLFYSTFAWSQTNSPLPELSNLNRFFNHSERFSGQLGNVYYAPIILDGRPIFFIAVPSTIIQEKGDNKVSLLEQRVRTIENNLQEIIKRGFDPNTLQVSLSVLNSQTVIIASDQKNLSQQIIGTITQSDVQLYGESIDKIGEEATKIIQKALLQAYEERLPSNFQRQFIFSAIILLVVIIITLIIFKIQKILRIRLSTIKQCLNEAKIVSSKKTDKINNFFDYLSFTLYFYFARQKLVPPPDLDKNLKNFIAQPDRFLNEKELKNILEKEIKTEILYIRLLLLGIILIWVQAISFILGLFPHTRQNSLQLAGTPITLLVIWSGVTIGSRLLEFAIDLFLNSWTENILLTESTYQRQVSRISTFGSAVKGISTIILIATGIILSLQTFQVPVTPVLAGASILGFAISFGSQSIIKDIFSGTINLMNDSYAVGDLVIIGTDAGLVEDFNLFVTRVRSANGDLITIPNGLVGIVRNQSKDWSRIDYRVQVSYETEVEKALLVLLEVAQSLYDDEKWSEFMVEPPELKGIEDLSHQGITLRIWLKTQPGKQLLVAGELRLRVKEAFIAAGIKIGIPQHSILVQNSYSQLENLEKS